MLRKLLLPALATSLLAGCATDYAYRGGNGGDYYYGTPGIEYRHVYPYGGWGYFDPWFGSPFDAYGFGWYGRHGYFGGYRGYPYYAPRWRHDRDPRHDGRGRGGDHDHGQEDDDGDGNPFSPIPGAMRGDDARPLPHDGGARRRPLPRDPQETATPRPPRRAEPTQAPRQPPQRVPAISADQGHDQRSPAPRMRGKARP